MNKHKIEVPLLSLLQGDIVEVNSTKMVFFRVISNEGPGSCGYDRKYVFINLDKLNKFVKDDIVLLCETTLMFDTYSITVEGFEVPNIIRLTNEPPFEFTFEKAYKIRRKVPASVIVYE